MNYPGGKNSCYQKIINLIPPHTTYLETHLGSGAVLRNKRPARRSIGLDADPEVIRVANIALSDVPAAEFHCVDAVKFLSGYDWQGDEFIYCDPPYVMSSRRQQRPIYRCEYTDKDHEDLLGVLVDLPCKVMISGYWSEMYDSALRGWTVATFEAMTRGGALAIEYLWMNYPAPTELHDYSFLGDNFRERERIKRKVRRWVTGLERLPVLERKAIVAAINGYGEGGQP